MISLHKLQARGISATLDLGLGQLHSLVVRRNARDINPWARVPWADAPDDGTRFGAEMPPHLRRMSADFFCAPFVLDDVDGAPAHGWPANGRWSLVSDLPIENGREATFVLEEKVAGARVHKVWTLLDDHPFLYQCHRFTGGNAALPMAHHMMLDLRRGGLLAFSPKLWAQTPASPIDAGAEGAHSVLHYPAKSNDLTSFPSRIGAVDLTRYPIADQHDDFVMLVDDPSVELGWATALRPASHDVAMLIKPVSTLPQTMLWLSNGGRSYAPWNGEHVGVLGIEEACSFGASGRIASTRHNPLTELGIATAIDLRAAKIVEIRTAMGALPSSARTPLRLRIEAERVVLSDGTSAPFAGHLVT